MVVGIAVAWLICLNAIGSRPAAMTAGGIATLIVLLFWWFVLWPVQGTAIIGSVYTITGKYGTSRIDLSEVTDISARFVPYSGTWLTIKTPDNELQILKSRSARRDLLAIGDVLRETQFGPVRSVRVERALGLDH